MQLSLCLLDGIEVCRQLRADGQNVGVLFLTARDTVSDKVQGLTIGGDDYMTKPFSLEELIALIKSNGVIVHPKTF